MNSKQEALFKTEMVPAKDGSGQLFEEQMIPNATPVICLGKSFPDDQARRTYFTELLAEKLRDPEFRKIEGFPIGSDEDILKLSDPPYYTACPNPWIADFIAEWEAQKPEKPEGFTYHREPFAADVSEGKNDPIYNAHSYHTKVPHKAIMRYILHYTEPGDIVFDGFCGTGMTGVAAQLCGDRKVVESLGFLVQPDGTILQEETDENGNKTWTPFSRLGARRAVLNDLSPAATFIAYNYNTPVDVAAFEKEAKRILKEVEDECGWMYETLHTDGKTKGKINYTVWSDVFVCPNCSGEVVFWEVALDKEAGKVKDEFPCPHCSSSLTKRNMERAWVTRFDSAINENVRQARQVPVLISYTAEKKRYEKAPDAFDLELIERIDRSEIPHWFPTKLLPKGDKTGEPLRIGITHTNHFYTARNLTNLSAFRCKVKTSNNTLFLCNSIVNRSTQMNRIHLKNFFFGGGGWNAGYMKGTLYFSSLPVETSILEQIEDRISSISKAFSAIGHAYPNIVSTCSSTITNIDDCSLDYLFIDPPFGANIMYSELNYLWEAWLGVLTNNSLEAIENKSQNKGISEYRQLITACFNEAYRVLKPGRWMTVEFSNTNASVWNSIQTAMTEAGFIVANVSALDKKQGSFNAVTNTTSVKQDLVISAYKPNGGFEERFLKEAQTEEGIWDFVRTHLQYLPVTKRQGSLMQVIPERDPRILFDQMVAYYVRKGYPVPISSVEFQIGLSQRFIERDGMYFLPDQVAEYDRKKMHSGGIEQAVMFVKDEATAIQWLRQLIKEKPQTFQEINPQFMQQLGGWSKNEAQLDLRELLNQNFISYEGKEPVPEQIHAYLSSNWKELRNLTKDDPSLVAKAQDRWYVPDPNKAGDLEKLREKALLKEFSEYRQFPKKLKVFRLEAVRAGFKKSWQDRDYATIITVAEKIPNNVLEEDPKLLMWYDQAITRMGE
ncbi:MAG: DNA methylase [Chlorobiaceae bacterium]|nr:DNA methylase [Chlorobiaceae bacterium]